MDAGGVYSKADVQTVVDYKRNIIFIRDPLDALRKLEKFPRRSLLLAELHHRNTALDRTLNAFLNGIAGHKPAVSAQVQSIVNFHKFQAFLPVIQA